MQQFNEPHRKRKTLKSAIYQIYQLALHWALFYWISMYWKVLHWSAMYWLWTDVLICNTFTLWNWPDNNQLHWQLFSNTLSLTYFDLVSSNVIFKLWYRAAELAVGQFFLSLLASPPTLFINWSKLPRNAPNCSKQVQNSQVLIIKHLVSGNFWDWLKSFNTDTFTWCEFQSLILTLLNVEELIMRAISEMIAN